jgi:hypothetical protein
MPGELLLDSERRCRGRRRRTRRPEVSRCRNRESASLSEASSTAQAISTATGISDDVDVALQSVSGDVTVTLRGEGNARIRVDAGPGGDIDNAIGGGDGAPVRHGPSERLDLKLGSGRGNVEVSTLSGTVSLRN